MNVIKNIFESQQINYELLEEIEKKTEPSTKYLIAMTPRSGSSHLCDVLKNTNKLGNPGEFLPAEFIPKILLKAPAKNADDYLANVMKLMQSSNGISGVKASWFQFQQFCGALENKGVTKTFKYVYLIRRDLALQAVSLYKATESSYFHTNIAHSDDVVKKNKNLDYNFETIDKWYKHIVAQEDGWQNFFLVNNIFPLFITYEEIEADVSRVIKRIASYIGSNQQLSVNTDSIFKKIGDKKNIEWAYKYMLEKNDSGY